MGAIGVFEADANARRLSAEAAASNGFELEKAIDRAIFRARERFGAYLANSKSRPEWEERWEEVKPQVIKVIAEVTTPTPKIIRRVGAALRPAKQDRPSSAKTASAGTPWLPAGEAAGMKRDLTTAMAADLPGAAKRARQEQKQATITKAAWSYDNITKLWSSADPMQKFACPDCGTEQEHLGFTHCAGCDRTWNSWPVRQQSSAKTGASTYMLMAREIKMRGDQFKLAAAGNVKIAESDDDKKDDDEGDGTPFDTTSGDDEDDDKTHDDDDGDKYEKTSATKKAMPMQPNFGTMPGDNSGAMGSPALAEQPPTPMAAAGDRDQDNDVAGGVTEDSPIDQIQDALQDAIMALKDVQMLSVNPALTMTSSAKSQKILTLRTSMDRFWSLHKQMNYVAGMLAKEANEAIRTADPRLTSEAEFVRGFQAASRNLPLPVPSVNRQKDKDFLEGYIAFYKQADVYDDGANIGGLFQPDPGDDKTNGARNEGSFLGDDGPGGVDDAAQNQTEEGPADGAAASNFAAHMDAENSRGGADRGQGESGSIQPTGARRRR